MLYLELTLPCIKVEAKQRCNSSSAKPTEQQQLGCVCCAQPLSSTSSQPLWRSLELTWEIDWCCWAAPIANSTFFYKDCQQYVDGFLCCQDSRIHERRAPFSSHDGARTVAYRRNLPRLQGDAPGDCWWKSGPKVDADTTAP
jgi:hypothetical protein